MVQHELVENNSWERDKAEGGRGRMGAGGGRQDFWEGGNRGERKAPYVIEPRNINR